MNDRLKEIRSHFNLSQEEFGERINIRSRAHISLLESGNRNFTDRIINDICRVFSVNEEWLRYGTGEMFIVNNETTLDLLAKEYNLNDFGYKLIETLLELKPEEQEVLKKIILSLIEKLGIETFENKPEDESYPYIAGLVAENNEDVYSPY